ncbi:hypothetical protein GGH99_004651 [Coemansia sp. RSA 1285]|nr:hypothetical protein GGH99_004651 [Coemansia sp. RSA 1285]
MMVVRRAEGTVLKAMAALALGYLALGSSTVLGRAVSKKGMVDMGASGVVTQTIVSDIDANLSRFIPDMIMEAQQAENAAATPAFNKEAWVLG